MDVQVLQEDDKGAVEAHCHVMSVTNGLVMLVKDTSEED